MELDHVFILCDEGAPEAEALLRLGIREGTGNTHPGQGTACRRFFFANAYLELLWVADSAEAGSEPARRTRLLDRWALRRAGACPFGVILRPSVDSPEARPPFPPWSYTPPYLPPGFAIDVADGPLAEPAVFHMAVQRGRGRSADQPIDHEPPLRTVSRVSIH